MPAILVVDDEPTIRALLRAALEQVGYRILEAADGAGALRQARSHPDLVLLDIALPDINGLEVCRRLKADPSTAGTPVLLLTGLAQPSDRRAARDAGAVGCIEKPFRPADLVSHIADVLRRQAAAPSR
jgi:CheY-like chemotaxis protein